MKSNIFKAILWGISIMIGLAIVDVLDGRKIDIIHALLSGFVAVIVDFCFSLIYGGKKKKNDK